MLKKILSIAVMAVFACTATVASAETAAERLTKGVDLINARFGPAEEFRVPPSASDPEVAKALADINASVDAMGTEAFPIDGLSTFFTVCLSMNQTSVRYMTPGLNHIKGAEGKAPMTPQDFAALMQQPEAVALMERNSVQYQDGVTVFLAGSVKCIGVHMPILADFWMGLPLSDRTAARLQGVSQMRNGSKQMVTGAVMATTEPAMSPANRKRLITMVASQMDAVADIMPVADRKVLLQDITAAAPNLAKSYPDEHAKIVAALSQTACTGLCLAS